MAGAGMDPYYNASFGFGGVYAPSARSAGRVQGSGPGGVGTVQSGELGSGEIRSGLEFGSGIEEARQNLGHLGAEVRGNLAEAKVLMSRGDLFHSAAGSIGLRAAPSMSPPVTAGVVSRVGMFAGT